MQSDAGGEEVSKLRLASETRPYTLWHHVVSWLLCLFLFMSSLNCWWKTLTLIVKLIILNFKNQKLPRDNMSTPKWFWWTRAAVINFSEFFDQFNTFLLISLPMCLIDGHIFCSLWHLTSSFEHTNRVYWKLGLERAAPNYKILIHDAQHVNILCALLAWKYNKKVNHVFFIVCLILWQRIRELMS